MIIDSHEHLMFPTEYQIQKLDEAGIDKAILFCTTPHPERANTYQELKDEMNSLYKVLSGDNSKKSNLEQFENNINDLSEIIKKHPERFLGFGAVPLEMSLDKTIGYIEKHIISNGFKGIGEFTPGSKDQISQLEVIFQALNNFPQLPVWIHTFNPVSEDALKSLMDLTQKYPNVTVIYGHMGGYHWMDVVDFAKTVPNAYIDLSAAFSTLAVRMAITELPDKCIFSSDAPYGEPLLSKQLIEFVSPSKEITDKILGENILKILK